MVEKIKAVLIFEMLGRPVEHLKNTLVQFVEKISQEDGVEILNKKIHEPKKIEEAKQELFTTFAETELSFKDMPSMFKIIFMYMPSHIEIIEPEEIKIKNFDLNILMTELARKLHQYDEIAKKLSIERSILQRQLQGQGMQPAISPPQQQKPEEAGKTKETKKKSKIEKSKGKKVKKKSRKKKK